MKVSEIKIGAKVKCLRDFSGVPSGSFGFIIEDYGSGITIGWDLKEKPFPKNISFEQINKMFAINPECPLRDGFDKAEELQYLEVV